MNLNIFGILFLCSFYTGWSQTIEDARALNNDLLANYSRILRPRRNQMEAVSVQMGIELLSIQSFDEVQETLTMTAVIFLDWVDELMTWNPDDYGGIDEVRFESDQVWTPMLVLLNSVERLKKIGFEDSWLLVTFGNNGSASFYPGGVLSLKCEVDVTYFPWDKHKCELQFTTWGLHANHLYFTPASDHVNLSYYTQNGAWDYLSSSVSAYNNSLFIIDIVLGRKPRFVVVNVISPIVLMAMISAVVFCIPVESGERMSYSITMLLAMAVFLTLIGDNLPKTSNPMSIFSYYLISILILNIFMTLANILSLRIYHKSEKKPVGSCFVNLTRCLMRKKRKKRKFQYKSNTSDDSDYESEQHRYRPRKEIHNHRPTHYVAGSFNNGMAGQLSACGRSLHGKELNIRNNGERQVSDEATRSAKLCLREDDEDITWQEVSVAVDKVCFVTFVLLTLSLTFVFFFVIWIGGNADV